MRPVLLSQAELAVRIFEALNGIERLGDLTARDFLAGLDQQLPGIRAQLLTAAFVASEYFHECVAEAGAAEGPMKIHRSH